MKQPKTVRGQYDVIINWLRIFV